MAHIYRSLIRDDHRMNRQTHAQLSTIYVHITSLLKQKCLLDVSLHHTPTRK